MRRLVGVLGVSLVLLTWSAALPALAANPQVNTFKDSWSGEEDPDFCGTGETITFSGSVRVTEQLAPNHADFTATFSGHDVLTNPETGDQVFSHWAGHVTETFVSGDDEGIHVIESTTRGLPESFRLPGGGVLTLDAGSITLLLTFDGEEFVSLEVVVQHGPHPAADSDFEQFCEIMPAALGIE